MDFQLLPIRLQFGRATEHGIPVGLLVVAILMRLAPGVFDLVPVAHFHLGYRHRALSKKVDLSLQQ